MEQTPDSPTPLQAALRKLEIIDVSKALYGVPLKTVYRWKDGTRKPPGWMQSLILSALGPLLAAANSTAEKNNS